VNNIAHSTDKKLLLSINNMGINFRILIFILLISTPSVGQNLTSKLLPTYVSVGVQSSVPTVNLPAIDPNVYGIISLKSTFQPMNPLLRIGSIVKLKNSERYSIIAAIGYGPNNVQLDCQKASGEHFLLSYRIHAYHSEMSFRADFNKFYVSSGLKVRLMIGGTLEDSLSLGSDLGLSDKTGNLIYDDNRAVAPFVQVGYSFNKKFSTEFYYDYPLGRMYIYQKALSSNISLGGALGLSLTYRLKT
jgi:hypothetical protein